MSVLLFGFSRDALEALANRVGQCVMTCPTSACYNGLPLDEKTAACHGVGAVQHNAVERRYAISLVRDDDVGWELTHVIGLRLTRMAFGGMGARAEAFRMASEKI